MTESSLRSEKTVRPAVLGVIALLTLIWGTTYFVIREGLVDLPPFTAAAARFLLAASVFTALAGALAKREGGASPGWKLVLVQGFLNLGVPYAVVYWSETILPSGFVSVIWGVFPMFVAMAGAFVLPTERLSRAQWAGIGIGLLGLGALFRTDLASLGPDSVRAGFVVLVAPASSAIGQVLVKRDGAGVSSLRLTRPGLWIAAAFLAALAFTLERDAQAAWTGRALFSIAYLALLGTVVTFTLYFWALRHAPAVLLSLIAYLTPAIALTVGALLGDEPVTAWTVAGLALILSGVTLVFRRHPA